MDENLPKVGNMKDIFNRIRIKQKLSSDKECWEMLGISKTFFQEVKAGRRHISNEKAPRIASKAFLSVEAVLVLMNREKAAKGEEKDAWNRIITGERRIMDNMGNNEC